MARSVSIGAEGLSDRESLGPISLGSRVVVIAFVFWLARLAAGVAVAALTGAHGPDPIAELGAGGVVGVTLGWLAPRLRGSSWARVVIVSVVLTVNVAAVMIEGAAFAPAASPIGLLPLQLLLQTLVSVGVAWTAVALLPGAASVAPPVPKHGLGWWTKRLAATTLLYVVAYFVTGAVNYALVTGPYYESHSGGLTTPAIGVVLGVSLIEGTLMSVGMVPVVRRLARGPRLRRALTAGLLLFILGGLVPLVQATTLPEVIRIASAFEILFQKVPVGLAIALLFKAA